MRTAHANKTGSTPAVPSEGVERVDGKSFVSTSVQEFLLYPYGLMNVLVVDENCARSSISTSSPTRRTDAD